ncbi:MAG: phage tail family protein [Eubacteriales bacterium]
MTDEVSFKIIRSDGATFTVDGTDWDILSDGLDGWGDVSNAITSITSAFGDGSLSTTHRVASKDRSFSAVTNNLWLSEILRRSATSFFRAKYTYDVYFTYMGETRWATGYLSKFECPTKNIYDYVEFTVVFYFESPFLKSVDDYGENIADTIPCIGFPYICPIGNPLPTSYYREASIVLIENDGDVETYCKAVFRSSGEVLNPTLRVGEGYVTVNTTMVEGDVLIMDFTEKPPTIELNGESIVRYADKLSTFSQMGFKVGSNTIEYDAEDGADLLEVCIYYNKLYETI